MKRRNLALTPEARAAASEKLFGAVARLPAFAGAETVGLFCALDDEPATQAVLQQWSRRKRLVVPRVEGDTMQFYEYAPVTMCAGAFGIDEPGPGARLCDPAEIDLIVIPGTAFTPAGVRIGRGKGYYDKYLSQPGIRAEKVGVCYAHQLVGEIPAEPHDVGMDCVVTD